mmetsp:Transcript_18161/g.45133  ORF Transcript_18161/g.45133 Transcript_18161/m.45133 type:complete len:211 (+) Transcript_18161:371-1003(+)
MLQERDEIRIQSARVHGPEGQQSHVVVHHPLVEELLAVRHGVWAHPFQQGGRSVHAFDYVGEVYQRRDVGVVAFHHVLQKVQEVIVALAPEDLSNQRLASEPISMAALDHHRLKKREHLLDEPRHEHHPIHALCLLELVPRHPQPMKDVLVENIRYRRNERGFLVAVRRQPQVHERDEEVREAEEAVCAQRLLFAPGQVVLLLPQVVPRS